jgi:hypothetical protein
MRVARFAEGTKVSVESSRGEISGILAKHGCMRMAWATEPRGDTLQFELDDKQFRFAMKRPTAEEVRARDGHEYTYPHNVDWELKAEAEWRRVWRANVLLLKAKLEFIDGGDTTLEKEFMPYLVMKGGRTLGDFIDGGGLLQLTGG